MVRCASLVFISCVLTIGSSQAQTDGSNKPTLANTLEWLSEKIPQAGTYSEEWVNSFTGNTIRTEVATRFGADGCQITIERRSDTTRPSGKAGAVLEMSRIPLGTVKPDSLALATRRIHSSATKVIAGPEFQYEIYIHTDGNVVAVRTETTDDDPSNRSGPDNNLYDGAALIFHDEVLAQRIMNAIKYAAQICRAQKASKPEPF